MISRTFCTTICSIKLWVEIFLIHQLQLKVHALTQSKLKWTVLSNFKENIYIVNITRQCKEDAVKRNSHQGVTQGRKEKDWLLMDDNKQYMDFLKEICEQMEKTSSDSVRIFLLSIHNTALTITQYGLHRWCPRNPTKTLTSSKLPSCM